MKKILVCILTLAMLLSCLTLTSCGAKKTDTIDGVSVEEAYAAAIKSLGEIERYQVDLSMKVSFEILSVPIYRINVDPFYHYSYDGANEHHWLDTDAKKILDSQDMSDIYSDMDDDIWYYDGVCYVSNGSNKYKFASEETPLERSEYEEAIDKIVADGAGKTQCYKKGDLYYFVVTITEQDDMALDDEAVKEVYTVYFTADGYIQQILVEVDLGFFTSYSYKVNYVYDGLDPVTPPADAEDYRNSYD